MAFIIIEHINIIMLMSFYLISETIAFKTYKMNVIFRQIWMFTRRRHQVWLFLFSFMLKIWYQEQKGLIIKAFYFKENTVHINITFISFLFSYIICTQL